MCCHLIVYIPPIDSSIDSSIDCTDLVHTNSNLHTDFAASTDYTAPLIDSVNFSTSLDRCIGSCHIDYTVVSRYGRYCPVKHNPYPVSCTHNCFNPSNSIDTLHCNFSCNPTDCTTNHRHWVVGKHHSIDTRCCTGYILLTNNPSDTLIQHTTTLVSSLTNSLLASIMLPALLSIDCIVVMVVSLLLAVCC